MIPSAAQVNSVEVTWADQQNINSFGKLNNRKHELLAYVKAKKVRPTR